MILFSLLKQEQKEDLKNYPNQQEIMMIDNSKPIKIISLTENQSYDMIKLYDILRDMDFELTEHQENVFMRILDYH